MYIFKKNDEIMSNKSLNAALNEAYLDNYCISASFWTKRNLCGHRSTVHVCDLDCLNGIVRVKAFAIEKDIIHIFRFAMHIVSLNCKVSVVYDEQFQSYIEEVKNN